MSDELVLKVEDVKKRYRLGVIGGGTLQGDLQSWWAKVRGKEDPNQKIGAENNTKKGTFMALDGISFEVKKGERLGIIGGNGAGKSTTLKILSRVTAPTEGTVYINGRISSMLEVGTGFHPELTGRENIYLNGAILGMTKAEVDQKMDAIIEFSECGKFIDTPVKRYSSGMYVKLAFSVAAHLDSEIMIMDEVLAVGDMKFQQKCLKKMQDVAENEGRTILYVSHNMNTIRQLCNRCVVLQKGKLVYDGEVEEAISIYMGADLRSSQNHIEIVENMRDPSLKNPNVKISELNVEKENNSFQYGDILSFKIKMKSCIERDIKVCLRAQIKTLGGTSIMMSTTKEEICFQSKEERLKEYDMDISNLVPGKYTLTLVIYEVGEFGTDSNIEVLRDIYIFNIRGKIGFNHNMPWNSQWWGYITNGYLVEKK